MTKHSSACNEANDRSSRELCICASQVCAFCGATYCKTTSCHVCGKFRNEQFDDLPFEIRAKILDHAKACRSLRYVSINANTCDCQRCEFERYIRTPHSSSSYGAHP